MNAWNIFCILIRQILFKIRTHELAENQELFTVASCGLVIRYLIGILSCSMMVLHCTMKYSIDCIKWKVTILFCGKIVAIVVDAYTNSKLQWLPLTRAVQGFFFWFGGRQWNVTMVFTHWPRKDSLPVSWALKGKCRHFNSFAIFCYKISHHIISRLWGVWICWEFVGGNLNYGLIYTL